MKRLIFAALIWTGIALACPHTWAQEKIAVYVSIPPQKFFVQSIGGERVDVSAMVLPGANPHTYEPTPAQMKNLASARIYFAIGDPFEEVWLKKISAANPNMKLVHTEDGIEKKPVRRHETIFKPHSNEKNDHGHSHGINDPHIWLSPPLAMLQSRNILFALIDEMPQYRDFFENNYTILLNQLIELDADLRFLFKDDANKEFLVFHPSWGYFADAYHLRQSSIELDGKEPKAKEISQLIQHARKHGIQHIFSQPQFSTKHADAIAKEINGQVLYADPVAENWMDNLKSVARLIKQALR